MSDSLRDRIAAAIANHQPWKIDPETGDYIDCPCAVHATYRAQDWGDLYA